MSVVMTRVLGKDARQVALANDDHPVGALSAYGAHPAFCKRVRSGCLWWRLDHVEAFPGEHGVEDGREFAVPVVQQEPQPGRPLVELHQHVSCLLGNPCAGRMRGDADDMDPAGGELYEEQHVDPFEEHGVDGEEVAGQDRVGRGGEELFPGRSRSAGCRVDAGLVEDLPDGARGLSGSNIRFGRLTCCSVAGATGAGSG
jgi:hypothetical protein